jgi:hypothetical protein
MLRNPNHVIDSVRRRDGPGTAEEGKYRWTQAVRTIHQARQEYSTYVKLVRFYNLVVRPEITVRGICSFLGINFDDRMVKKGAFNQYGYEEINENVAKKHVKNYEIEKYDMESLEMYKNMIKEL